MTGEFLKVVLEDVADNIFNPDPYYQQGGDMVRTGGMGYRIDVTKPQGERISDMTLLKTGEAIDPARDLRGRRLGQRQRGHRRPADLGRGRKPYPQAGHRHRGAPTTASKVVARDRAADAEGDADKKRRDEEMSETVEWRRRAFLKRPPRRPGRCRRRGRAAAAGDARSADHRSAGLGRGLGDGVDATPYGLPIEFESRRGPPQRAEWLTADRSRRSTSRRSTRWTARSRRRAAPSSGTIRARSSCARKTTG
jgi:hypothetical protein